MANLYLLPSLLTPDGKDHISKISFDKISSTRIFIVERIRSARRFIKTLHKDFPIDEARFIELNKHQIPQALIEVKDIFDMGQDVILMSEAGSPCIADPGARVVNIARKAGYSIRPLSGPSSIMLGLMASGMNGQHFTFHGYLPIKEGLLRTKLEEISESAMKQGSTHIFIETPYRNIQLCDQVIKTVDKRLYLSVALNLNGQNEKIITNSISKWSSGWIDKSPAIFCIGTLAS